MLGIHRREHLFFAEELIVVLLGLGIEARIVIRIPGLRASRARIDRLIQTAQAPRAGLPGPGVVAMSRLGVTIAQQAGPASVLWGKLGTEQEQPQAIGLFEVGIGRQRLHFGSTNEIVTGIVPELSIRDFEKGLVVAAVDRVAIEVAQIVIIRLNR